jgi:hypothetical protein
MSNRRLVPMPPDRHEGPQHAGEVPLSESPPAPIVPTFGNSWPYFAWLIVTAIVMYYAKWPILVIAALVGFFRGQYWLCNRYPRTMFVILTIVRGMMGRGRR